ncbi:hypothetical protein [Flavobacterium sp.]|uniref:hypothetical protein n=1 Tax=Flavobacterium sp. TaxID=239 RepID=UPI00286E0F24|nr:hypothetical protein [Flavobacterium sp.]
MATSKNNSIFKIGTLFFGISLIVTLGFSLLYFKSIRQNENNLKTEKQLMIDNLVKSRDSLSKVITENSSIKRELLVEQQRVMNLIEEVSNANLDLEELNKFKVEVTNLRRQIVVLKKEKYQLAQKYQALKAKQDSTSYVLENSVKKNENLEAKNNDMNRMILKSSKISMVGLKTETLRQGLSGSFATNKAARVNVLKISFMVLGNKLAKPCDKEYYVQIIDNNNNVIGERRSIKFGPMILDYSYSSTFKYEKENLEVTTDVELSNVEKGTYFVNIFDKDNLTLKTSFVLK